MDSPNSKTQESHASVDLQAFDFECGEMLEFEKSLLVEMKDDPKTDALYVFGQGVPSIPQAIASFLSTFKSLQKYEVGD